MASHRRRRLPALLLFALVGCGGGAPDAPPPSFVLLMSDDQGWGDVGYNGHPYLRTPHLDAMAAAGLRLDRMYAAAPVCSPTRGSVLTGRHPARYGIHLANMGSLPGAELTLPELLGAHGYRTGHFGKWHLGTLTRDVDESNRGAESPAHYSPPWKHGFRVTFSTEAKVPTWDPMLRPEEAGGRGWREIEEKSEAVPYGTHYWSNGEVVTEGLEGDDSRIIMDRVIPFVREAVRASEPFLAVVWFHAPHTPVVTSRHYMELYEGRSAFERRYLGCLTAMDEQVGRLRHELEELGVARDTLVVFCSDNGPETTADSPGSSGGLRAGKRTLWEGGVRVPGLVVWPRGIEPGTRSDVACVTTDLLPTLLDLAGIEMPDARPLDGISLRSLFSGGLAARPAPIGFQSGTHDALIGQRHKLLRTGSREPWRLYDLSVDPAEENDLAAERPELVRAMADELEAWRASCLRSDAGADYP